MTWMVIGYAMVFSFVFGFLLEEFISEKDTDAPWYGAAWHQCAFGAAVFGLFWLPLVITGLVVRVSGTSFLVPSSPAHVWFQARSEAPDYKS